MLRPLTKVASIPLFDDDIETLAAEDGLKLGVLEKAREHARTAARGKYEGVVTDHKKKSI